jgi:hypothetical protein
MFNFENLILNELRVFFLSLGKLKFLLDQLMKRFIMKFHLLSLRNGTLKVKRLCKI